MAGTILKTGSVVTKAADKIVINATNGDIDLSSAKSIAQSSDKDITHGSYKQPEKPKEETLLVEKVEGPAKIEAGKSYTYKATSFSRKAIGGELKLVKWAYQIDGGKITDFEKPGVVIGSIVKKVIDIPGSLCDNKKLLVYAYLQAPNVFTESEIDRVQLPMIVDRYRVKGEKSAGVMADDLHYGDGVNLATGHSIYSRKSIEDLGWLMSNDIDRSESSHWWNFRFMVTSLFSVGDLEVVVLKMIDRFKSNVGGEFIDPVLTKKVKEHASTIRFSDSIKTHITDTLIREKGNLKPLKNEIVHWTDNAFGHPRFGTWGDKFAGGLTICMNDTWAYEVSVTEYEVDGTSFKGKYKIMLYDNFGLDQPDVEKVYSWLIGFRSWYILQHMKNYKPFITTIELEETFEGTF